MERKLSYVMITGLIPRKRLKRIVMNNVMIRDVLERVQTSALRVEINEWISKLFLKRLFCMRY